MANIRIKDLPSDSAPSQNDIIPIDLSGTRGATVKSIVEAGRPTASRSEAELGVEPQKAMTPLTTKQAIDAQVSATYVPKTVKINAGSGLTGGGELSGDVTVGLTTTNIDRLNKVDGIEAGAQVNTVNSVNAKTGNVVLSAGDVGLGNVDNTSDASKPISTATQAALDDKANSSVTISAGSGLTGGGTLEANRTIALSSASIASLALADSAVQSVNGKSGNSVVITPSDVGAAPDTVIADINANTTARHTHANKAILDATTASFLADEKTKLSGIEAGAQVNTVTSVAGKTGEVTLNAEDVSAIPDTFIEDIEDNTLARHTHSNKAILDATTASFLADEKTKLSGIEAGAQVNTVTSVAGKTGEVTLVKGDVGLGNVDNTSDANKPISTATQTALNAKANSSVTISAGAGLTGGGNLTANRSIALNAASIASLEKAETALQAPGGSTGQILAKSSNTDNDVGWVSSEAATAVSYGPQELTEAQRTQAKTNLDLQNVPNKSEAQMVASGAIADALGGKLDKTGGTLTGPLTLDDVPSAPMEAANKQYVDTGLANKVSNSRITISTANPSGGVNNDVWFKVT